MNNPTPAPDQPSTWRQISDWARKDSPLTLACLLRHVVRPSIYLTVYLVLLSSSISGGPQGFPAHWSNILLSSLIIVSFIQAGLWLIAGRTLLGTLAVIVDAGALILFAFMANSMVMFFTDRVGSGKMFYRYLEEALSLSAVIGLIFAVSAFIAAINDTQREPVAPFELKKYLNGPFRDPTTFVFKSTMDSSDQDPTASGGQSSP